MEKIKQFILSEKGKDFLIVMIVILVGLGSFELGRLSKENDLSGIKIDYIDQNEQGIDQTASAIGSTPENTTQNTTIVPSKSQNDSTGKNYFASNRGSKYYSVGCAAGKTIKEENKIWFRTGEEAKQAGYTLSSGCY